MYIFRHNSHYYNIDNYSLNFIASISPKHTAYNISDNVLQNTVAGFGTNVQLMFIYNH